MIRCLWQSKFSRLETEKNAYRIPVLWVKYITNWHLFLACLNLLRTCFNKKKKKALWCTCACFRSDVASFSTGHTTDVWVILWQCHFQNILHYAFISIKHSEDSCFVMENVKTFVHVCQYSQALNIIIWAFFLIHLNCKLSSSV